MKQEMMKMIMQQQTLSVACIKILNIQLASVWRHRVKREPQVVNKAREKVTESARWRIMREISSHQARYSGLHSGGMAYLMAAFSVSNTTVTNSIIMVRKTISVYLGGCLCLGR